MKWLLTIFLFACHLSYSQNHSVNFSSIDWYVKDIEATNPEALAKQLTAPYPTQLEKTRAIFSWIAQHVSYNTGIYNSGKRYKAANLVEDPSDSVSEKSAIEQTAERVLRRRVTVCDGYAKLFKTLCNYAGLPSELITGYAKGYVERNDQFRTNHTWNAVMIDSAWHLLDVTWGSGYVTNANEYVSRIDETYFLTPPREFIIDHYPEDVRWTLMDHSPTLREFGFSPLKCKAFIKYTIQSFAPSHGLVEAHVGDTLQFLIHFSDLEKDGKKASDFFLDSASLVPTASSYFIKPQIETNKAVYTFIVKSEAVEWIHLMYNDDAVLLYKVNVKPEKSIK